jgi:hypothetical protein
MSAVCILTKNFVFIAASEGVIPTPKGEKEEQGLGPTNR